MTQIDFTPAMIDKLTDQAKSVLLIHAMGYVYTRHYDNDGYFGGFTDIYLGDEIFSTVWSLKPSDDWEAKFNLYDLEHFLESWKVLNWAETNGPFCQWPSGKTRSPHNIFSSWWREQDIWGDDAEVAMRLWLDKILELLIESGLVRANNDQG